MKCSEWWKMRSNDDNNSHGSTQRLQLSTILSIFYYCYYCFSLPPPNFQLVCFLCITPFTCSLWRFIFMRAFALFLILFCSKVHENHHAHLKAMKHTQKFLSFISLSRYPFFSLCHASFRRHCILYANVLCLGFFEKFDAHSESFLKILKAF